MHDRYFTEEVENALELAIEAFAAAFADAMGTSLNSTESLIGFYEHGSRLHFGEGQELQLTASHLRGFENEDED